MYWVFIFDYLQMGVNVKDYSVVSFGGCLCVKEARENVATEDGV